MKPLTLKGVHGGALQARGMLGKLRSQGTGKIPIAEYEDAQFYGPITVGCVLDADADAVADVLALRLCHHLCRCG